MKNRLGVIADTHGQNEAWVEAVCLWGEIDGVLHAGDVLSPEFSELAESIKSAPFPVIISRGNTDSPEDEDLLGFSVMSPYCTVW